MNPNQYMPIIVGVLVVYTWGTLNRGWTSPADIAGYALHRAGVHRLCWPQDCRPDEGDPDDPPEPAEVYPPDDPPPLARRIPPASGGLPYGPAQDLSTHHAHRVDPTKADRGPGETRLSWTRRMVTSGLWTLAEVDQLGAEVWDVHPDSVRRWRRQLAKAGTEGTPADDDPEA